MFENDESNHYNIENNIVHAIKCIATMDVFDDRLEENENFVSIDDHDYASNNTQTKNVCLNLNDTRDITIEEETLHANVDAEFGLTTYDSVENDLYIYNTDNDNISVIDVYDTDDVCIFLKIIVYSICDISDFLFYKTYRKP